MIQAGGSRVILDILMEMAGAMPQTLTVPRRLLAVARMIRAFAGPPVATWAPRPPLPAAALPEAYGLGGGITLWRLQVGLVRIREWHRALPERFSTLQDKIRFPVMMTDRTITDWLECTVWLIEHPERRIIVDTGESAAFGSSLYFKDVPKATGKTYPKIIDATAAPGNDLKSVLTATGLQLSPKDICVLTHTHSDHIGNLAELPSSTRLLVSPEELVPGERSGRLLGKLPRGGRLMQTVRHQPNEVFGPVMPLTERGDVFAIATPGHTVGHQSVVIDLGERQIILGGDAAFDDDQVERGVIPGIIEDRTLALQTYAMLLRVRNAKPTLTLFTHDPLNATKLRSFTAV